jgi:hypothetical protein
MRHPDIAKGREVAHNQSDGSELRS